MSVEGINYLKSRPELYATNANSSDRKVYSMQSSNSLERTPKKDTVNFKGNPQLTSYHDILNLKQMTGYSRPSDFLKNYEMDMQGSGQSYDNFHLIIENKLGGRIVKGEIFTKDVDLKIDSKFGNMLKGSITGKIDGKDVDIKYQESADRKGIEIIGDVPNTGEIPNGDFAPILSLLVYDLAEQCNKKMQV